MTSRNLTPKFSYVVEVTAASGVDATVPLPRSRARYFTWRDLFSGRHYNSYSLSPQYKQKLRLRWSVLNCVLLTKIKEKWIHIQSLIQLYFGIRPIRYVSYKTRKNISEQITAEIICRFKILTLPWQNLISLSHSLLDFSSFLSSSSFPPR